MILTQCNKSNKNKQGFKHNHINEHNNYTTCNKSVHSKTDNKYRTKAEDDGGQVVHEELRGMQQMNE